MRRDAARLRPRLLAAVVRSNATGRSPLNARSLIWNDPTSSNQRSFVSGSFSFLLGDESGNDGPKAS